MASMASAPSISRYRPLTYETPCPELFAHGRRGLVRGRYAWAAVSFFFPYLRVKRSTRPAESISFCFPVKNGWQLEQISSRSSWPLVDRVVQFAPQAQCTFTVTYSGCI